MKVLVTGAAGFIGAALSQKLADENHEVLGIDNLNDYYDPNLKLARLSLLKKNSKFRFEKLDIIDRPPLEKILKDFRPEKIINLAAQAGVRYSVTNPDAYIKSNLIGFGNILEITRHLEVKHLIYASTSSVYGLNTRLPFSNRDHPDHPVSLYAATKRANELMAHSYSHMFQLPTTGVRFFTVYGPWGRPDMALFLFTKNILEDKPIELFNNGNHRRSFTYIDDIVTGVAKIVNGPAPIANPDFDLDQPDPSSSIAPFKIYNIGNSHSEKLSRYIEVLEKCLGKEATKTFLPMQPGDVVESAADTSDLKKDFDYCPVTDIEYGIKKFVEWYLDYYKRK